MQFYYKKQEVKLMAKSNVSLGGRDILDLESLSVEEIELVLKTADEEDYEEGYQKGALTAR